MTTFSDHRRIEVTGRQIDLPMLEYGGCNESAAAHSASWHDHEGWEIFALVKGTLSWEFSDGTVLGPVRGGQGRLTAPKVRHRGCHGVHSPNDFAWAVVYPDAPRRRRHAPLSPEEWETLMGRFKVAGNCVFEASPTLLRLVHWLQKALLRRNRESGMPETVPWIRSLFCQLVLETSRCLSASDSPREDKYVSEAIEFFRSHLKERIRAKDLQRFLGFGHTQVYEMFKRTVGLSPNDYLQRLRIEKAEQLLLQTELSVSDVAAEVGFDTGQYFAAVFKKYTGQTPTAFRKAGNRRQP